MLPNKNSLTFEDLNELISIINRRYGFDFSHYSKASLKRRFERLFEIHNYSLFDLKSRIINENNFISNIITEVTVNVTEMFRDEGLYKSFSTNVLPYLTSFQQIKVWHAGVSSGEELYSFSIFFEEHNLYNRSFFYGTDINEEVLKEAKEGIYSLKKMKSYAENYAKVGLYSSFSNYYTVKYDYAIMSNKLKKNALFSIHNLISDGVFNEFQLVICRNVLIYFDQELQDKVINLMIDSLCTLGFLCLGSKESIRSVEIKKRLKVIDLRENIYQKL